MLRFGPVYVNYKLGYNNTRADKYKFGDDLKQTRYSFPSDLQS